jgi:nucleotide-binding universal stress UspA family protein
MLTPTIPKTILVPVDYGEASRLALEHALVLARSFGAKLVLVFAWAAPYAELPLSSEHPTKEQQNLLDLVRKESEDTMVGFIRQVQAEAKGVELEWFILSGDPAKVVLEQATALAVDLIVMGTRGKKSAARWFLGSVAEAVVRHAPCPVMVVPPNEHEGAREAVT